MITRVEHWSLRSRPSGQTQPPEEEGVCLFGFVFGHPRHRDGREVFTSPVMYYGANRVVTKSGTEYELGLVDPSYERRYPGAFERLLARLEMAPQEQAETLEPACAGRQWVGPH